MGKTYIFGHKNPDTDSVTSAIALSYLKNKQGLECVPVVLDNINAETEFVLNYFGIKTPEYINDVKLKIEDIEYYKDYYVTEKVSILKTYEIIKENNVTAIPVIAENQKLLGLVTLKTIANELIKGNFNTIETSYDNIRETLNGKEIYKAYDEIKGNILVATYRSQTIMTDIEMDEHTILIVGDRGKVIDYAIENKVGQLILTGGQILTKEQEELAIKNKVNVISTNYDSFYTAKLINLSAHVKVLLNDARIESVRKSDYLDTLLDKSAKKGYNNYPVINEKGKCDGLIRITDIKKKNRKKVILVDHNEMEQSVIGLEEAEIIEIVDHHKIGNLTTSKPINFRNMGVGSTNTIVYMMYKEARIEIPKNIAGIMIAGIMSDTLNLTSPTTTEYDIEAVEKLTETSGINREDFVMQMFRKGTDISTKTTEEIVTSDLKTFQIDNRKIGVAQVFTLEAEQLLEDKEKYVEAMEKIREARGYSMLILYLTDIVKKGSYVLYTEGAKEILKAAMDIDRIHQGIYRKGILSRKKQIIPRLMKMI